MHCIGGIIGNLLTGFFAADYIAALDGFTVIEGGWINRHWIQLAIQLADSVAGMVYSFIVTSAILLTMYFLGERFPVMRLRVSEEEEQRGIDDTELGEFAYDYVEFGRDALPPGPAMTTTVLHGVKSHEEMDDDDDGVSSRSDSRVAFGRRREYGREMSAREMSSSPPPPPQSRRGKGDEFPMTSISRSPVDRPGYLG